MRAFQSGRGYALISPSSVISRHGPAAIANDTPNAGPSNPTRTTNDIEPSLYATLRAKAQYERAHAAIATTSASGSRTSSPLMVDDTSTLLSILTDTTTNEQPNPLLSFVSRKLRKIGSSSRRRRPSIRDASRALLPIAPIPSFLIPSSATPSDHPSLPYIPQTEIDSSHRHPHSPHLHRQRVIDDPNFARPDDGETEAVFQNTARKRDLPIFPPFTFEQSSSIVESDERLRWKDEKAREEQAKKVPEQSRTGMVKERSPEWYLIKFMERSITPKDASGLLVSLRGHEVGWLQKFISMQGTLVLTQFISHVSRKGKQRIETDHQLEYATLCCLKQILNSWPATQDALTHSLFISQIAFSLSSPHLAPRKLIVEILAFLVYRVPESLNLVTGALEAVSTENNVGNSPYAYWFASFERPLSQHIKLGGLVDARGEFRKNAAIESNINEYALNNLLLVNAILENSDGLDLRMYHHRQMIAAGLRRVIDLCRSFDFEPLKIQLDRLQRTIESNGKGSRERLDPEILKDEGIDDAIKPRTRGMNTHDYPLSTQFEDALDHESKVTNGGDGLVGLLKGKIARLEEKLQFSRETTDRLQVQLEAQESDYEEEISQLEALMMTQKLRYEEQITRLETQLKVQKSGYENQIPLFETQDMASF